MYMYMYTVRSMRYRCDDVYDVHVYSVAGNFGEHLIWRISPQNVLNLATYLAWVRIEAMHNSVIQLYMYIVYWRDFKLKTSPTCIYIVSFPV